MQNSWPNWSSTYIWQVFTSKTSNCCSWTASMGRLTRIAQEHSFSKLYAQVIFCTHNPQKFVTAPSLLVSMARSFFELPARVLVYISKWTRELTHANSSGQFIFENPLNSTIMAPPTLKSRCRDSQAPPDSLPLDYQDSGIGIINRPFCSCFLPQHTLRVWRTFQMLLWVLF